MRFPSLSEYRQAVQNPVHAFRNDDVLKSGAAQLNPQRMPVVASGGFAATFQINSGGIRWAVRCFHKNESRDRRLLDRYQRIDQFITENRDLDFLVPVKYRADGILVNGEHYPTVRMPWVDGRPLGIWLEDWAGAPKPDPGLLNTVRSSIRDAAAALRARGAAHGDLQHGNILVRPDHSVWLIDYDGMYLDDLAGFGPIEQGHRNYQHPGRSGQYDPALDIFAAESIELSLAALAQKPTLWDDFGGTGENILFEAADFANPDKSQIFSELSRIPSLENRTRRFREACLTAYAQIPAALTGGSTTRNNDSRSVPTALVFAAREAEALRAEEGQPVTVFGTIVRTNVFDTAYGRLAVINLGDYKKGDFTIVGFGSVADALYKKYGGTTSKGDKYLPRIKGKRVAVSGAIMLYSSAHSTNLTPQIELDHAGLLRFIDETQFRSFATAARHRDSTPIPASLPADRSASPTDHVAAPSPPAAASPQPTPAATTTIPKPKAPADRSADLAVGLHNLYKDRRLPPRATPPPTMPKAAEASQRPTNAARPADRKASEPTAPTRPSVPRQAPPPVPPRYRREQLPRPATSATRSTSEATERTARTESTPRPADRAGAKPTTSPPPPQPPPPVPPRYRREELPRPTVPAPPPTYPQSPRQRRNTAITIAVLAGGSALSAVMAASACLADQYHASAPALFQSPSMNLACRITPDGPDAGVRCDVENYTYAPPDPAGCLEPRYGSTITLTPMGAQFSCVSDTLINRQLPVLAYGDSKTAGSYTCTSHTDGIACRDKRPHGRRFRIARDTYELS
ncbi:MULTISPECIES: hypothetical protein [Nocardia]|uniref:hypothetical protein n=1 Tax=Nocardia abscessus TaxID=120957 RepID=UPI001895A112|nr:hypothetical protein [Nocardia abscessus]MBF6471616.1 hypothetical protein [Nocardia abscessus]